MGGTASLRVPIIAASTPGDCFMAAYEAIRIAVKYMTPVILLTDGQLANGAEPWLVPDASKLPEIKVEFAQQVDGETSAVCCATRKRCRVRGRFPARPALSIVSAESPASI